MMVLSRRVAPCPSNGEVRGTLSTMALSAHRSLRLGGLRSAPQGDGLGPVLFGTLPVASEKLTIGGVATTVYAVAKLKKGTDDEKLAPVGPAAPVGRPYSPHGRVELILEANPHGAHYHGALERRDLSPVKRKTPSAFRESVAYHETLKVLEATSEARANALIPRMNTRLGSRFPRELIKESAMRVTSCAAGKDSAHHLSGSVSAPGLLATERQPKKQTAAAAERLGGVADGAAHDAITHSAAAALPGSRLPPSTPAAARSSGRSSGTGARHGKRKRQAGARRDVT